MEEICLFEEMLRETTKKRCWGIIVGRCILGSIQKNRNIAREIEDLVCWVEILILNNFVRRS